MRIETVAQGKVNPEIARVILAKLNIMLPSSAGFRLDETNPETVVRLVLTSFEVDRTSPATANIGLSRCTVNTRLEATYTEIDPKTHTTGDSANFAASFSFSFRDEPRQMQLGIFDRLLRMPTAGIGRGCKDQGADSPNSVNDGLVRKLVEELRMRVAPVEDLLELPLPTGKLSDLSQLAMEHQWQILADRVKVTPRLERPSDDAYRFYLLGLANEALAYQQSAAYTLAVKTAAPPGTPANVTGVLYAEKSADAYEEALKLHPSSSEFQSALRRAERARSRLQTIVRREQALGAKVVQQLVPPSPPNPPLSNERQTRLQKLVEMCRHKVPLEIIKEVATEGRGQLPNSISPQAKLELFSACGVDYATGLLREVGIDTSETPISRYANIESKTTVSPNEYFNVQVSLVRIPIRSSMSPAKQPGAGTKISEDGGIVTTLPGQGPWTLDVVLSGPDFSLSSPDSATIQLRTGEDSSIANFKLQASGSKTGGPIHATFYFQGRCLARATTHVTVASMKPSGFLEPRANGFREAPFVSEADRSAVSAVRVTLDFRRAPDLTIAVWEDEFGRGREDCTVYVSSPYFPPIKSFCLPRIQIEPWFKEQYRRLQDTTRGLDKEELRTHLLGFGRELYTGAVPEAVKQGLRQLAKARGVSPAKPSIQIYTSNPWFPWEMVAPDGGGFLGFDYLVARWHNQPISGNPGKGPVATFGGVIHQIVPKYDDKTGPSQPSGQRREFGTVSGPLKLVQLGGSLDAFRRAVTESRRGIVHFSGHGSIEGVAAPHFQLSLENGQSIDSTKLKGLPGPEGGRIDGRPFFFFNACRVGSSSLTLGVIDGWAPLLLDRGASGFLGPIWPVSEPVATDFARYFYGALAKQFAGGRPALVAELVRLARIGDGAEPDPAVLGYVFYGEVDLEFTPYP